MGEYQGVYDVVDNQQMDVINYVKNYFSGKGWTIEAICGLLGNMDAESEYKVGISEYGRTGYGLLQWTGASYDTFIAQCKQIGVKYDTKEGQCALIQYQMANDGGEQYYKSSGNSYKGGGTEPDIGFGYSPSEYMNSKDSVDILAFAFMVGYERPSSEKKDKNGEYTYHYPRRKAAAEYWYKTFTGNNSGSSTGGSSSGGSNSSGNITVPSTLPSPDSGSIIKQNGNPLVLTATSNGKGAVFFPISRIVFTTLEIQPSI